MATMVKVPVAAALGLENGDRMTRAEFHAAYLQTPPGFKAELVGGIVYVPSPVGRRHGLDHLFVAGICMHYVSVTPGVESGDNASLLLSDDAEPQPDVFVRILPEHGGQSRTSEDDYVEGAPEMVIEVAHRSQSIDLHAKRADYARYGVQEYVVWSVAEKKLYWFGPGDDEHAIPEDGILRSHAFPGLWLDAAALRDRDGQRALTTLQRGLASPGHAAFAATLAKAR